MQDRGKNLEMLTAYVDGELSPADKARVEQQLKADPSLQVELEGLRGVRKLIRQLPRQTVSEDFVSRVMAAAERTHLVQSPVRHVEVQPFRWVRWAATAAVLAIAVSIGAVITVALWNPPNFSETIGYGGRRATPPAPIVAQPDRDGAYGERLDRSNGRPGDENKDAFKGGYYGKSRDREKDGKMGEAAENVYMYVDDLPTAQADLEKSLKNVNLDPLAEEAPAVKKNTGDKNADDINRSLKEQPGGKTGQELAMAPRQVQYVVYVQDEAQRQQVNGELNKLQRRQEIARANNAGNIRKESSGRGHGPEGTAVATATPKGGGMSKGDGLSKTGGGGGGAGGGLVSAKPVDKGGKAEGDLVVPGKDLKDNSIATKDTVADNTVANGNMARQSPSAGTPTPAPTTGTKAEIPHELANKPDFTDSVPDGPAKHVTGGAAIAAASKPGIAPAACPAAPTTMAVAAVAPSKPGPSPATRSALATTAPALVANGGVVLGPSAGAAQSKADGGWELPTAGKPATSEPRTAASQPASKLDTQYDSTEIANLGSGDQVKGICKEATAGERAGGVATQPAADFATERQHEDSQVHEQYVRYGAQSAPSDEKKLNDDKPETRVLAQNDANTYQNNGYQNRDLQKQKLQTTAQNVWAFNGKDANGRLAMGGKPIVVILMLDDEAGRVGGQSGINSAAEVRSKVCEAESTPAASQSNQPPNGN